MSLRDGDRELGQHRLRPARSLDIGPEAMDEMAQQMGVTSPLSRLPRRGARAPADVTVLDQSNAFATIADGGVHHDPTAIRKVVFPDGDVDEPEDQEGNRVVTDGVAYTVADVMKGTLDYGTAVGYDIGCPAAGKTGTTEEQADAWFVGYTPHVSTAVWVGNPDARVAAARLRRRPRGADLARLHDGRGDASRATTSRDRRTRPTCPAYSSAHTGGYERRLDRLDHRHLRHDDDAATTTTPTTPGPATPTATTRTSTPRAPARTPAPTPNTGGARRRRPELARRRASPASGAVQCPRERLSSS